MILGIDPWIRKLGYALVDNDLRIVDAWVLLLRHDSKKQWKITREEYRDRMHQIFAFFEKMNAEYAWKIDCVCVEKLFFTAKNQSNAEFVYGIRWCLMMLFQREGIELLEYTPMQLKKYITGNMKASKDLVVAVVKKLFSLDDIAFHDTADALGLAYLAKQKMAS